MTEPDVKRRCESCMWAEPSVVDNGPVLECHRYPPHTGSDHGEIVRVWPQVESSDWCGEFRKQEPSRWYP